MLLTLWAILNVFILVFITELGDKTQLAAFSLASSTKKPWVIFAASSLAFLLSSTVAAILGSLLANQMAFVSSYVAPFLFIAFGFIILLRKEPPAIYHAFAAVAKQENLLVKKFLAEFKKRSLLTPQLAKVFNEEDHHEKLFKKFISRKFLFKDDINNDLPVISFNDKINFKTISNQQLVEEALAIEESSNRFYKTVLAHLEANANHKDDPMIDVIRAMIKDEEEHIGVFKAILTNLKEGQA
ncbi:MAG: TMEM165/GDT1 family protein [Spirochaetaceae bacterium]|nr:TMEM165/GDT1 family protein [Spirochaetaceae bacterium]